MTESYEKLIPQFEKERLAEDKRLMSLEDVRISAHSPQNTHLWETERIQKRVQALMKWTEQWWRERGWLVSWDIESTRAKAFQGLRLPEASLEPLPSPQ